MDATELSARRMRRWERDVTERATKVIYENWPDAALPVFATCPVCKSVCRPSELATALELDGEKIRVCQPCAITLKLVDGPVDLLE